MNDNIRRCGKTTLLFGHFSPSPAVMHALTIAGLAAGVLAWALALAGPGAAAVRLPLACAAMGALVLRILLEQRMRIPGLCTVSADNEGGAARICKLLLQLGHRRLAFLTGAVRWPAPERRLAGFREAAACSNLDVAVLRAPSWTVESWAERCSTG